MKQADNALNGNGARDKLAKSAMDIKNSKEYETLRGLARSFADKEYEEIDDIKSDLDSLRNNVVKLTRNLKQDGLETAENVKEHLKESVHALREKGEESLKRVEDKVRDNPRNSVLLAFGAGILASILLRRR